MADKNFGFKKSKLDGSEKIFGIYTGNKMPEKYIYSKLSPIINQGSQPICVPCSISAYLNWKLNLKEGNTLKDNHIDLMEIFKNGNGGDDGMSFKDAFAFLRHIGVKTDKGKVTIRQYGLIRNILALKYAILMNGPCVGALPVYSDRDDFWNKRGGDSLMGYHAISLTGFDDKGFIIRNSWGKSFGKDGYTKIKFEDSDKFVELWTIIK